jgi:hypothetical protein
MEVREMCACMHVCMYACGVVPSFRWPLESLLTDWLGSPVWSLSGPLWPQIPQTPQTTNTRQLCTCFAFCLCFASALHVLCVCFACALRVLCMSFACVLHLLCMCSACVLHVFCIRFACALHVFCMCFASALHVLCMLLAVSPLRPELCMHLHSAALNPFFVRRTLAMEDRSVCTSRYVSGHDAKLQQ